MDQIIKDAFDLMLLNFLCQHERMIIMVQVASSFFG